MKRNSFIFVSIVTIILRFLGYCYSTRSKQSSINITAVGSTALQPLIEAAGEQFAADNYGVYVNVQGGGTGTGLAQIQLGAVSLGNSDVFAQEKKGINYKKLVDHKVAVVGIAPIVNKKAGIKNLTSNELIKIFTGKITNWKQIGGNNVNIILVNRAPGSGTRFNFEKWGLKSNKSADGQEQDSSGMVRSIVQSTPGAISYEAFSYLNKTVTIPTLNNIKPTKNNVENGLWNIWAYEHVYTKGNPTGKVKEFLKYLETNKVQRNIVPQLGYIPINDMKIKRTVNGKISNN